MVSRTIRARRRTTLLPEGIGEFVRRRLVELGGLALMVMAGFLALSLATYSPADESFNTAGTGEISNGAGRLGAYAADLVLQGTGVAGSALVLIFLAWGWGVLSHRGLPRWGLRIALVLIALLAASASFAALPQPAGWPVPSGTGGSLGLIVGHALLPYAQAIGLGAAGFAALAFASSLGALLPAFGLSLSEWRAIGRGSLRVVLFVGHGALRLARAVGEREAREREARPVRPRERAEPRLFVPSEAQSGAGDADEGFPARPPQDRPPLEIVERRRAKWPSGKRGEAERQRALDLLPSEDYRLPPLGLLTEPPPSAKAALNQEAFAQNARLLESVLEDFGVQGEIVKVRPGPVVTLYELEPAPGTKSSRVIGLADDIARYMSAISVRAAVIPGRNVIGIELPNATREMVYLRELLLSEAYGKTAARLALALGKDISGAPTIVDLERMPHLLIAGTTGLGKSVAINSMILSLIYRLPPEQCKFVMIDPKMLELSVYDDIPQLLAPVVTNPSKAIVALKWTVREMESRYQAMSQLGVRHITSYNKRLAEARERDEVLTRTVQTGFDFETGEPIYEEQALELDPLPFIIVIVDEMADLMLLAGKEVEAAIQRLSQMARAAGIHLIMATQRPSVDVITGTIKANFPTRISFQVTSKIDSRTIIGEQGAEQLLGQGDMLYLEAGGRITRVHGPFVSDAEVERVAAFLKRQGRPEYLEAVTEEPDSDLPPGLEAAAEDPLYDQAVALIRRERKASTSFLQRHLQIGYNRAARIIERMESEGMIGPPNHVGKREVLARNIAE